MYVAKTGGMFSFTVTTKLICVFGFLMTQLIYVAVQPQKMARGLNFGYRK